MTSFAELAARIERDEDRRQSIVVRAASLFSTFGERIVLHGIDLAVRDGEILVVMGPSGCGKTTLLRHLCGALPPALGTVTVRGHDLYGSSPELLQHVRLRTGLSFQGGALLGSLTVLENVALPLRENTDLPDEIVVETARMKLDMVGLLYSAHLYPSSLSGGMKKRAALARAIALDPEVVYFDEPSAGLDPVTAAEVDNLIVKLNHVFGITMVVVTHDLASAYEIADRVVVLLDGRIAADGTRDEIWQSADPRIRAFVERRVRREDGAGADVMSFLEI